MSKKSYINISLVSAGNIFNTVLGFLFFTAVARTLSLEDFGKYSLLTSLITLLARGTDFGSNSLFVAKSITSEDKKLLNVLYSLKLILLLFFVPISLVALWALKIISPAIMLIFILGLTAYCANFTLHSLFQKEENFLMLISINVILATIKAVAALLIFLNIFKPDLVSSFGIYSLSVFPSLLLILFLPKEYRKFNFSFKDTFKFFKESFPAGISILISEGWSAIANSLTSLASSFSNVGLYSLADKLSTIFALISYSVFTVLLPKNARLKKESKEYDFSETILISLGILLLAFLGMLVSQFVVVPVFGENFKSSLPVLYILLFSSAFTAINSFMENYFFVEQKTDKLLPISITKLITFVGLSIILIPNYSINGIAYASLASSLFVTFLIFIFIKRTHSK